jgi:hypothetical protein
MKSSAALLSLGWVSNACNTKKNSEENTKPVDDCNDFSGVAEAELEKRKKFAYTKQSTDPTKQCNSCKLFLPPKSGEPCGGCLLFKGPVDSKGSCTYWAPLD